MHKITTLQLLPLSVNITSLNIHQPIQDLKLSPPPSVCPSVHPSPLTHISNYPSIHPPTHQSIHSSINPSVSQSTHPSIHPPTNPSIHPHQQSTHQSIHPPINPSITLYSSNDDEMTKQIPRLLPAIKNFITGFIDYNKHSVCFIFKQA